MHYIIMPDSTSAEDYIESKMSSGNDWRVVFNILEQYNYIRVMAQGAVVVPVHVHKALQEAYISVTKLLDNDINHEE